MKKILCFFALCAALLLSACGRTGAAAKETETPTKPEAAVNTTAPSEPTAEPREDPSLTALLGQIRERMQIGTAGSSLKACMLAVELLNWAEETETSKASVDLTLKNYLAGLDTDSREEFLWQLSAVEASCETLTQGTPEAARALLSDAGCEDRGYPWSPSAAERAQAVLGAAGLA